MIDLEIDVPDNEWMSANDRMHYMAKSKRTKAIRGRARMLARSAGLIVPTPTFVVAEIGYPKGTGKADPANSYPSLKAALDGLTDAGAWPDDDSSHVIGPKFDRGKNLTVGKWHRIHLKFINQHLPF